MSRSLIRNVAMGSLLMMVTVFLATTSAHGQSSGDHLRAKIPFDFVVGNSKLPAGEYFFGNALTTSDLVLAISNRDSIANTLTIRAEIRTRTDTSKLIFHRYGDQYFLFQVWQQGTMTGRTIQKSHAEREIERKARLSAPLGADNRGIVETVPIVAYEQ